MKKIISVLMCLTLVFGLFVGCAKSAEQNYDIVMITDGASIKDGGYNESAWNGLTAYAIENAMTYHYYQPSLEDGELTVSGVEKYVKLAVKNGAQFIVFPGEKFSVPAYDMAMEYPDVKFILIDGTPHSAEDLTDRYLANVMTVKFDATQAGYLAGYLAVLNGNTKLGYFGDASSLTSASYGGGYVQGAAAAADELGIPVTLDWADYNSFATDYNYDFTLKACYKPVSEVDEETFNIKVENGIGTGTYTTGSNVTVTADTAPVGQVFDHWEVKSDTEGVKDSKVNISSKTKSSMNLLVEKCDATITAVYKDIEGDFKTVTVMKEDGKTVFEKYGVKVDDGISVKAPAADKGKVFDHWETEADLGDTDLTCSEIWVDVKDADITLTPVYAESENPAFYVTVETGEGGDGASSGSGSYVAGDTVEVAAAVPKDGYMFSHWENVDAYGLGTGISMENEFYWNTTFEMVDRYSSICETMFNKGVTTIFDGGNASKDSAYSAKWNYDFDLNVISAGENNKDSYFTVVNDYGEAVKDCLENFQGGFPSLANCSTKGIYVTYNIENEELKAKFDSVYEGLASGNIAPVQTQNGAGYLFCKYFEEHKMSKCLTLNGWFLETVEFKPL